MKKLADNSRSGPKQLLFEIPKPEVVAATLRLISPEILERVARIEEAQYVPQKTWKFEFIV